MVVCSLVACFSCKKDDKKNGGKELNGITINQGSSIEMVQGSQRRLSMKTDPEGLTGVAYTYSSENPLCVEVDENGIIYANMVTSNPVTVTVNATANGKTVSATIAVTVKSLVDALVFDEVVLMQKTDDWQEQDYAIYEIRRYNKGLDGGLTADMSHVVTQPEDTAGEAKYNSDYIPEAGKYSFLYTKENEETGKLDTVGVFMDSVHTMRAWLMSEDCIFTQEGFSVIDNGAVFEFVLCYMAKNNTAYVLGDHEIVEDATAYDKIRPQGVEARPMPSTIQAGHFNADEYIDFFTSLLNKEEVDISDFDFFSKYDAQILPVRMVEDETTGEETPSINPLYGYPLAGGAIEFDQPTTKTGVNWLVAPAYAFSAQMYDNPFMYCLKVTEVEDPETGEMVVVFDMNEGRAQMAESQLINFTKGTPQQAPRHNAVNPVDNAKPMSLNGVKLMQNVNNAIYSTLDYAMRRR